jgi:glycosyltransferase involved in cell wall biosynthesis
MASGMMGDTGAAKLLESLCNLSYRSPDVIVAQSPGFSRLLISRGVAPDRLRVVYNWAPNAIEPVVASNFAADGFFRIVYAGNVGKVQGLDILLEAAAILKETHPTVRFIIVGSGTEYERLRLRSVGSSNVEFRERIPPDEVIPILTGAAALLLHLCDLPLFRTTIPSKLQQYLQVGRPILCGIDGDASDLVNEAGAGISFTPGSAESLVNAVQKLMAMPEENRDAMGKSGALFYRRYLSQEHGIAKLSAALSGEASAVDSE